MYKLCDLYTIIKHTMVIFIWRKKRLSCACTLLYFSVVVISLYNVGSFRVIKLFYINHNLLKAQKKLDPLQIFLPWLCINLLYCRVCVFNFFNDILKDSEAYWRGKIFSFSKYFLFIVRNYLLLFPGRMMPSYWKWKKKN